MTYKMKNNHFNKQRGGTHPPFLLSLCDQAHSSPSLYDSLSLSLSLSLRPNPSAPFYSDLESIDELCDLGSRFGVKGQ
ncbi:hypothetical protein PRUPE_2G119200 [Prunus persica]|uniref:Uncharacterized protein n=1 Tax=Prunus persica TaxID=3760 RepID=A0A251QFV8_PRUPE|nr:hypothetical protein PRUPE_2G119200 [Prunus persica]